MTEQHPEGSGGQAEQRAKPTPGPWKYEGDGWVAVDDHDNKDAHGHGVPICVIRGAQKHQIDANGKLIADAPATAAERDRLVKALEVALSAIDNYLRSAGSSTAGFIATRKLMAKAEAQGRAVLDESR